MSSLVTCPEVTDFIVDVGLRAPHELRLSGELGWVDIVVPIPIWPKATKKTGSDPRNLMSIKAN